MDQETDGDSVSVWGTFLRAIVLLGALVAFLAVGAWIVLGLTVMPVMKMGSDVWLVKWAAFPEGQIPTGSIVAVSSEPIARDFGSRLTDLLGMNTDERGIYGVIAGPGSEISADPGGEIVWNGQGTGVTSESGISPHLLGNNFLMVCMAGDCANPGAAVEVPVSHVLGEPLGTYQPPASIEAVPSLPTTVK